MEHLRTSCVKFERNGTEWNGNRCAVEQTRVQAEIARDVI